MAGHSQWSNTRHRRAKVNARREKIYNKLVRAITSAARQNPLPEMNPALRLAVAKALAANMTREMIQRAIDRSQGPGDQQAWLRLTYEGYGPKGAAYMISVLTDNRNRSAAEVRHALDQGEGRLGVDGDVAYLFQFSSWIRVRGKVLEEVIEVFLDLLEDVQEHEGDTVLLTQAQHLESIRAGVMERGHDVLEVHTGHRPIHWVHLDEVKDQERHEAILEALEDCDDVQEVFHNVMHHDYSGD